MIDTMVKTVNGYLICQAKNHHIPALNAIELAAVTLFPAGALPESVFADCLSLDALQTAKNEQLLWVAVTHQEDVLGHPVGYVLVQIVDGLALVAQIDVHPQHGRKGLGTALLTRAIQHMQERGFAALYLTTFSNVPWNAPFYETLGFVSMDEKNLPPAIVEILCKECSCGLINRVGMRLSLITC